MVNIALMLPIYFYIACAILAGVLVVMSWRAIDYYKEAKELAPYLRKKEEVEKQIAAKETELDVKSKELKELTQELVNAEKTIERGKLAQKELEEKQKIIDDLQENLKRLNRDIDEQTLNKQKLDKQVYDLNTQVVKDEATLKDLKEQIRQKEDELGALKVKSTIEKEWLLKSESKHKEMWADLDRPVITVCEKKEILPASQNEKEWLKSFGQKMENFGFIFPNRLLYAFHTALKCSNQTPLVVLAGLSGTGKSLLPELYSAALGMNFLPVPVQPRWDGPQDLFGFYNYMEGKYKATELSRLLWQFDGRNNDKAKGKEQPLNLILLDEMNLARVEYYFSDLLSKLEVRNGLDPSNDEQRRKAEIELAAGIGSGNTEDVHRLFVSDKTLFVGTMNEDESTQVLSDKVIDRAHVLRFGRPKSLAEKSSETGMQPDKKGFLKACADTNGQKAWEAWRRPLSDVNAQSQQPAINFLLETVNPLAKALDETGRGYGFRVHQAMELYVLNYPGNYQEAVADQIEMKILPKVDGMELGSGAFEEVKKHAQSAIDKTCDEELKEAFEKACEGEMFFKWRGVAR